MSRVQVNWFLNVDREVGMGRWTIYKFSILSSYPLSSDVFNVSLIINCYFFWLKGLCVDFLMCNKKNCNKCNSLNYYLLTGYLFCFVLISNLVLK